MKSIIYTIAILTTFIVNLTWAAGKGYNIFPKKSAKHEKTTPPESVQLLSPKDRAEIGDSTVKLEWSHADNADSYHIQVATDPKFYWLVLDEKLRKETNILVNVEKNQHYFWRVFPVKTSNEAGYIKGQANKRFFSTYQ